jgi:hypothetical protein
MFSTAQIFGRDFFFIKFFCAAFFIFILVFFSSFVYGLDDNNVGFDVNDPVFNEDVNSVYSFGVISDFNFDLNVVGGDVNSVDFNSVFDLNVGYDNNLQVVSGVLPDVNSVDFNSVFDLNVGYDNNLQVVSGVLPDLSRDLSFLSGFFVDSVRSVFSRLGRLVSAGFDFFGGFFSFDGFESQDDKNFVLNQREVFVNGRLVKCIGSACDKVPSEVD